MKAQPNDICITGLSGITRYGVGVEAVWQRLAEVSRAEGPADYSLSAFKAAKHIGDRRMLKAISHMDAIGLAAFEEAVKEAGLEKGDYPSDRMGVYVGAPAASAFDNEPYLEAQSKAGDDRKRFGTTCMESRPTTLLLGLPNNVLCYGSLVIDARGPNDNYTTGDLGGMIAVINAARQIRRGRLDFAVAGGFSAHTEAVNSWMFHRLGVARNPDTSPSFVSAPYGEGEAGTVIADGAAFLTIESRQSALARGASPVATLCAAAHCSDGLGPNRVAEKSDGAARAIKAALAQAGIGAEDVGLIFTSGFGTAPVDAAEVHAICEMFAKTKPPVAFLSRHIGNLFEASGLLEIGMAEKLATDFPASVRPAADGPLSAFRGPYDQTRPYFLSLRASAWGEYACLVLRRELDA